jgi:ATP-binding cassette subfamily B multidrug efflux pump
MNSTHSIKTYFRENSRVILLGVICLTVVDFLQLIIPRIIKLAVDDLTTYSVDSADLVIYAAWIMIIAILIAGLRYVWRRCLIGNPFGILFRQD